MEILETLNKTLLKKTSAKKSCRMDPQPYQHMAYSFSVAEHSVAVLSDMQLNRSYLFNSKTGTELGLEFGGNPAVIDSIWEEEILKKIHPDDKMRKYIHELKFFRLLETVKPEERSDFSVLSLIRMQDRNGDPRLVRHRMFYFYSTHNLKLRFALCLYNLVPDPPGNRMPVFSIINTVKGETVSEDTMIDNRILSKREIEVLKLIGDGCTSKEIAVVLCISINTVSRHRQNILEKLQVKNSVEAFQGMIRK